MYKVGLLSRCKVHECFKGVQCCLKKSIKAVLVWTVNSIPRITVQQEKAWQEGGLERKTCCMMTKRLCTDYSSYLSLFLSS